MTCFDFPNAYVGYPDLLRDVLEFGIDQAGRTGDVREVEDVMITFTDATKTHVPPRAGAAPLVGLLDGAQLLSGIPATELVTELFPKYAERSDFWGAYSARAAAFGQLGRVFQLLRDDPTTRRAVISLWDPAKDAESNYLDHPCALSVTFRVRDNALNMSVKMRSNDLWLCAPHDFVQFGLLQQTLATALNLVCGTYTHVADSLHIHHKDFEAAELAGSMMRHPSFQARHLPAPILPLSEPGWSLEDIENEAKGSYTAGESVFTSAGSDIKTRISARLTTVQELAF